MTMKTYLAINVSSRKFYVGSTNNFERRVRSHHNNTDNLPFQNALRKKPQNFYWICSEDDGSDNRDEEQFYLDFYHGSEWCYNLSPKTNTACVPFERRSEISKETHQKHPDLAKRMGETSQKNNPGLGAQTLQRYREENPQKSREHAVKAGQETARRHSKPVVCRETGVVYASTKEAARQTGINAANIGTSCKTNWKAGGYHWDYLKTLNLTLV